MPTLHALLIGINTYHPASHVKPLDGCINDVEAVEKFLKKHYDDLLQPRSIKKLINTRATRKNIIKTFENHLIKKAKAGDTVFFYYAGHGSFNESNEAFERHDGKRQDETFVCYDSRLEGKYDLADKEIAVLLSQIEQGVDIVFIADSCHSGSITRERLKSRFYSPCSDIRSIESYLLGQDNYYIRQLEDKGKISIPKSHHLLISACDRDQKSYETDNKRGLFTATLLSVLGDNLDVSYNSLFEEVRREVFQKSDKLQKPTLNAWEGFNPNSVFLRKDTKPNIRHAIYHKNDKWQMEYGAIYGLPTKAEQVELLKVGIYGSRTQSDIFIGKVEVEQVNLGNTWLKNSIELKEGEKYWGEVQNLPTALAVNLKGTKKDLANFEKLYNTLKPSSFIKLKKERNSCKYTLEVTSIRITIFETDTNRVVKEWDEISENQIKSIQESLEHIAKWETTVQLENEVQDNPLKEALELRFSVETSPNKLEEMEGNNLVFSFGKTKLNRQPTPIWYVIEGRNISRQPLYVALLHLSSDFEIKAYFQSQVLKANSDWKILDTEERGLIIQDDKAAQTTDIFKIIISNKAFDERKFLLPKLQQSQIRSTIGKVDYFEQLDLSEKELWFAHTYTVTLVRYEDKIDGRDIRLLKDQIIVESHPFLIGNIALAETSKNQTRSVTPWHNLSMKLASTNLELVSFSNSNRSLVNTSIIELSNVEGEDTLKESPLKINIKKSLREQETIVPVTLSGDFIIPVGTSTKYEADLIQVEVSHLITYDDTARKKSGRSLTRAAWFCFLKLTSNEASTFLLRKVKYVSGIPNRITVNKKDVREARKILLVIHGIIGDTKSIIKNLAFLKQEKKYDLILTFDYENLNTKIEDIAKKLNDLLTVELGLDTSKKFDILAHSMGGLVSRYLIEHVRGGDNLVDNLYMFGTPNGGSVFGKLAIYQNRLVHLLTIGLNLGSAWLGGIGVVLDYVKKGLKSSEYLTKTLKQMSPNSEFLQKLTDEKKVYTKYTIIAGDISDYKVKLDIRFTQLMEKVLLKIGNIVNVNKPNDIAVMVKDILDIPDDLKVNRHVVCCHHMNYFEEGEGLDKLREIL